MTKLSWAVVCVLVTFDSAVVVASFTGDIIGAGCNQLSCTDSVRTFSECFHENNQDENGKPINGAPCARNACISNSIIYSRCDPGEDTACKFRSSPLSAVSHQSVRNTTGCTSEATVTWNSHSSSSPCNGMRSYVTACETSHCSGVTLEVLSDYGRLVCD